MVYVLCLYAVAVRCKTWFVLSAGLVTVVGAILIDARTTVGAMLAAIPLLAGAYVRSRRSSRVELAEQASSTRASAPCWRNASASPGRCTTSWRTICR